MPNWCQNSFSVYHEDKEMLNKFSTALQNNNLFETFIPFPNGEWEYGWCVDSWGTKWDVGSSDFQVHEGENTITGIFDSAWTSPIEGFRKLEELGFVIDVVYHEPGMGFAGRYKDGEEKFFEYDFTLDDWADYITDEEVLDMLQTEYDNWLMWQEEDANEEC